MAGTQLPSNVLNFTSPILDRAVKTGGWGMTIKHHDPGKIGDAFFKKAQLDLGIANLQAEMGVNKAKILSGIEMQNASLNLEKAKMLMDYDIKNRQMSLLEKENDVGFFEGLFGTIAGAAQGAVGASAMGGSPWLGAAIGGAATGLGYATEGKKGGYAAREMLGTVANGAMVIKNIGDQQKAKDGWTSLMQNGADILSRMNTGTPQQRMAAQAEWDGHKQQIYQFEVDQMRMNPAQAAQAVQGYDKALRGDDPWGTAMVRRSLEAAADDSFKNPATAGASLKQFWADQSTNYFMKTGKHLPKEELMAMTESQFPGLMDSMGWGKPSADKKRPEGAENPAVSAPKPEFTPSMQPQDNIFGVGSPPPPQAPKIKPSEQFQVESVPSAQQPGRVPAPTPSQSAPVQQEWHAPMVLPDQEPSKAQAGVTMDTITELGQKAAGVLKKLDQSLTPGNIFQSSGQKMGQAAEEGAAQVSQKKQLEQSSANRKDWDVEIQSTVEKDALPFFTERNSGAMQKQYRVLDKHLEPDERKQVAGAMAAAAQMNVLRDDMEKMWDMGLDNEVLRDYQLYKTGQFGEGGMKGTSAGVMGGGTGGNWSSFERSARLSLEGKGIKGKAADEQIQLLRRIDAKVGPLAQSLAVAKQGARPSDADVKAYSEQIANLMDPNPDNSIAGLISMQQLVFEDFRSLMSITPSESSYMSRKRGEAMMGRESPTDAAAKKRAQLEAQDEFKKQKAANEMDWIFWQ